MRKHVITLKERSGVMKPSQAVERKRAAQERALEQLDAMTSAERRADFKEFCERYEAKSDQPFVLELR